jgi:hypothetical protein
MMRKIATAWVATLLVHGSAWAAEPSPAAASTPKPAAAAPAPTPAPAGKSSKRTVDRLQLESTAITGNRELPKVMNIVPWKAAEPPGGLDRPLNSLVEEVLSPLDRDEFRREITYYRDLTGQSAPVVAPGATQP